MSDYNFDNFRSEKEEVEMMKAVIPHLRLLTLPVDKLDPLSKYLSNSQKLFLANVMMFKHEDAADIVSPTINSSSVSRIRPKTLQGVLKKKFKLDFIAENLIKNDWQMMNLELKQNKMWNTSQIRLVAAQHLVLKGIEILTRANNSPKIEFVGNDDEISSR